MSCHGAGEPEARQLWEAVRDVYARLPDTIWSASRYSAQVAFVPEERAGIFAEVPEQWGYLNSRASLRGPLLRMRIERHGYAWPIAVGFGRYQSWQYPEFDAADAPHLLSRDFGARHDFVLREGPDGGFTLTFCPEDGGSDGNHVRGALTVSADTFLVHASWEFATSELDEQAGGEALYGTYHWGDLGPLLRPTEGLFWRRGGGHRVYQELRRYRAWRFGQREEVEPCAFAAPFRPESCSDPPR